MDRPPLKHAAIHLLHDLHLVVGNDKWWSYAFIAARLTEAGYSGVKGEGPVTKVQVGSAISTALGDAKKGINDWEIERQGQNGSFECRCVCNGIPKWIIGGHAISQNDLVKVMNSLKEFTG